MTDLEITILCARALGYLTEIIRPTQLPLRVARGNMGQQGRNDFDPLHNDEFLLQLEDWLVSRGNVLQYGKYWLTCWPTLDGLPDLQMQETYTGIESRRRFVCECVVKVYKGIQA